MFPVLRILRLALGAFLGIVIAILATYIYLAPSLPGVAALRDVELQVPLKVFSRDGKLIAVYGEQRREPLGVDEIPGSMVQAFLAAEDDRFYEHLGVDYQGLARAALHVLLTGEKRQGGSTVTMQLARNFFLDNERTYRRKLKEIFLALKIEHEFNKDEILELYLNKIYLGNRAYGVGAAAEVYYGRSVHDLNLAQIAMIAGLPKAPSRFNPIVNPERAVIRRNYVLGRMHKLEFIDDELYRQMLEEPVSASLNYPRVEMNAPYIGEMARAQMFREYGSKAYTKGYRVYTTINSTLQREAQRALRAGLHAYDRRHGWRGAEARLELQYMTQNTQADMQADTQVDTEGDTQADTQVDTEEDTRQIAYEPLDEAILDMDLTGGLMPAVVTRVEPLEIEAYLGEQQFAVLSIKQARWARPYLGVNSVGEVPQDFTAMLEPGDVIRITREGAGEWTLSQIPEAAGAFVAIDPQNGSVLALVGGYDYRHSKFNRATQAKRQPGSSFKPFIYSAALESGFTPASIVNDAPVVYDGSGLESDWRPKNYSGKFFGPTRLREALVKSRNMVSIRVLRSVGHRYTEEHVTSFGFDSEQIPQGLSLALGSGVATPLQMARGYAVFANGGYYVEPFVIERIEDFEGEVLFRSSPLMVCEADCLDLQQQLYRSGEEITVPDGAPDLGIRVAERVLSRENAYQMVSMMRDVIRSGTGRRARQLGRGDLAGKTGTTNEQRDAWFCGFNGDVVGVAWVGFDEHKSLGRKEAGSVAALPIWIEFMRAALQEKPENKLKRPETIVRVRIDPVTGQRVAPDSEHGIEETFRKGYVPAEGAAPGMQPAYQQNDEGMATPEQLF